MRAKEQTDTFVLHARPPPHSLSWESYFLHLTPCLHIFIKSRPLSTCHQHSDPPPSPLPRISADFSHTLRPKFPLPPVTILCLVLHDGRYFYHQPPVGALSIWIINHSIAHSHHPSYRADRRKNIGTQYGAAHIPCGEISADFLQEIRKKSEWGDVMRKERGGQKKKKEIAATSLWVAWMVITWAHRANNTEGLGQKETKAT